jgi:predicted aspartyl protease
VTKMPLVILALCAPIFVCPARSRVIPDGSNCSPTSAGADISGCSRTSAVRIELPFKLYAGYLVVIEGRIGSVKKLKFILDTGVIHSVVDRRVIQKLHLPVHPAQILNVNKTVAIERATLPDMQFGPVQVTDIPVLVADLADFSEFATHVDALIGMDLLRLNNLTIDNVAKKVLFDPLDKPASETSTKDDPVCMTAEVRLQDQPVRLIVDTGLQGILLYEERVLNRIPDLTVAAKTEVDIGRRLRAKQLSISSARLGSNEIDAKVWLVKGPPGNVLSGIDGFLGTSSLKARWIKFNFATNTLSWQ